VAWGVARGTLCNIYEQPIEEDVDVIKYCFGSWATVIVTVLYFLTRGAKLGFRLW
jgi:hypothetical protein